MTSVTTETRARVQSSAYESLEAMLREERCVVLDGGVATELQRVGTGVGPAAGLWGTWALYSAPSAVLEVHRAYAETGCNVISTNTWSILSAPEIERAGPSRPEIVHWMDIARAGVRLARRALADVGRERDCAVAFAISEEVNTRDRRETVELLSRVFENDPPDLVLLETLTLIRDPSTFETVELLLETGLPVWLSFRRCRHGVCGVFGQHWGPPEGDLFGRAARRFEELGVGALLINCLPRDHVDGMRPWLRDFTDLPLGVYPNLGYFSDWGWRFDERIGPEEYAKLAARWREQGAQIVGGCCGTSPAHVAATRERLAGTTAGRARPEPLPSSSPSWSPAPPWTDEQGHSVYPLVLPELTFDPDVFVPTLGSLLVWKHLFTTGAGAGKRCLDVGCGSGLLAVQLALNGAEQVHAIDIQRSAVANTLANAFRNDVSDSVTDAEVDLYMVEPERRYDLVVASLYQMPVDPFEQPGGHRPLDYWGRNLVDHLLRLLPRLLDDGGVAYVMQLSIVSRLQTEALLGEHGLTSRVVDYGFFPFTPLFERSLEQIDRVEQLSDAYH